MDRGIPILTLDETGQAVAIYPDGSVDPLPQTATPQFSMEGDPYAGDTAAGSAYPTDGARLYEPTLATDSTAGGTTTPRYRSGGSPYDQYDWDGGGDFDRGAAIPPPSNRPAFTVVPEYGGDSAERRGIIAPPSQPGPYPNYQSDIVGAIRYGGGTGGEGGGGGIPNVQGALASAKARIQGALGQAGIGGGGTGGGGGGGGGDRMRGPYARGLDPAQALGLSLRPTAMLPRVFKGISPADPAYTTLSSIPVGQMATILGRGTPRSLANKVGTIYRGAGTTGKLPSTDKLLSSLARGRGVEDMFQGVKAGPRDYASSIAPGYVYGQEPMPMGEAAATMGSLLDAALYAEPLATRMKYGSAPGGWGSFQIDKWASKALKKPAGKGKPIYRSVTRKLFK